MESAAINKPPLSKQPEHLHVLCEQLGLGNPAAVPEPVLGGFHHKMWRLKTDRGRYAIKQLGVDTDITDPNTVEHYNVTELVAETFALHDISVIHALKNRGVYLQTIADAGYMVYPWTDAVAIKPKTLSAPSAMKIAALMAKMHRANIQVSGLKETPLEHHARENIYLLVDRAIACHSRDYQYLEAHLSGLLAIAVRQEAAREMLSRQRVICHGDLDMKNVLWNAVGEPILIDWESARRLNATHETVSVGLEWSGITTAFEYSRFEQFIASYLQAGGVIDCDDLPAALDRVQGNWLDWLIFNVGRSIDLTDAEQRQLGAAQVDLTLATILRLEKFSSRLISRIRECVLAAYGGKQCSI